MKLNTTDLHYLCEYAISAAKKAGEMITGFSNKKVEVKHKEGGESLASQVVTEVDLKSQEIILKELEPSFEKYDLALLTEESTDNGSRLQKDYFWCIDPLDGTLAFTQSTPGYSVSIALVAKDGTPAIGVIYDPVKQTLYHAIRGEGAFRNGIKWKPTANGTNLHFFHDRSFKNEKKYSLVLNELKTIAKQQNLLDSKVVSLGGAAMNANWVLENGPGCYFKFPRTKAGGGSLWDFAASACLFTEAGAVVSDIYGNTLDLNRSDSTFMNHKGVLYASNQKLADAIIKMHQSL